VDNAVALVQAYLRVNGYFTVAEYPVLEARGGELRTATDLDILAFRFPRAGRLVTRRGRGRSHELVEAALDPALGPSADHADMIVGEVKEGRAVLNEAARDAGVLRAALVRFGCCPPAEAGSLVEVLLRDGHAFLPVGHQIRMVAFGSSAGGSGGARYHTITLGHAVRFLQDYLRDHWEVVRHSDHKDPAFGFLVMLEKALRVPGRGLRARSISGP
jgi:hypothetical protein